MIALKSPAPVTAVVMANALMEFAPARMVGEELTVRDAAQAMDSAAVAMASVSKENAIATLAGLVMLVISEPACTIAPNTDIAATVLAFAKRATEDATARFLLNLNLASVRSTVCADACNNAPRFTRPKELAHLMSATPNVHRSAFPNAWLERCQ